MTGAQGPIELARLLGAQGRAPEGLLLLNTAAARGDASALLELAIWRLTGQYVPRDLSASRDLFRRAAKGGDPDAAPIYNAFVANGTGAPTDWPGAMKLLHNRSKTDRDAARELQLIADMDLDEAGDPNAAPSGEILSAAPFVTLFRQLLTPAECRFLVDAAAPLLQPALTIHPETGQQIRNVIRTSDAAAFALVHERPAIHALNRRIAKASGIPVTHGEPLQVLRYRPGQEYKPHNDALPGTDNQRIFTMLVYLNDDYAGGET